MHSLIPSPPQFETRECGFPWIPSTNHNKCLLPKWSQKSLHGKLVPILPQSFKIGELRLRSFLECFFVFSISGAILGHSRAKVCYVVSFQVRIFQWSLPQISSDNQVCHESNVLTGNHKSIFYKLIIYCYTLSDNILLSIWILVTLFSSCVIVLYSLIQGLFYIRFYKTLSNIFYSY